SYQDLNWDKQPELFVYGSHGVMILNEKLETLFNRTLKELNITPDYYFSIKWNGSQELPSLCFSSPEGTGLFRLSVNPVYTWRYLIFPLVIGLTYLSLVIIHRLAAFFFIYLGFLLVYLKSSRNGVLIIDYKGRVISFNQKFLSLLHIANPIRRGEHFRKIFNDHPELLVIVQSLIKQNQEVSKQITLKFDGKVFERRLYLKPLTSWFDIPYGYLIEIGDVQTSELGERARIWAKTVQKLAHDIKTPLSSITVGLKTLEHYIVSSSLENKQELQEDLHTMRTEIERIHAITKSFLKFTNLESPNYRLSDIHQCLQQSLNRFKDFFEHGSIELSMDLDPEMELFYFDPQQMEMVFNIILENAIDAMKGSGSIAIQTTRVENVIENAPPLCEIEIFDSGPGIPLDQQNSIFEPFFTTKKDGTGMGLAIAKKIVEDHSGTITFYSKENLGTTFRITLPMRR
ncbi:MAG: GHKL domain-containing protein, partial [Calditrichaeota bacterium]|nr:GHKL domain-containing protein [Calditrichota bacterium]